MLYANAKAATIPATPKTKSPTALLWLPSLLAAAVELAAALDALAAEDPLLLRAGPGDGVAVTVPLAIVEGGAVLVTVSVVGATEEAKQLINFLSWHLTRGF